MRSFNSSSAFSEMEQILQTYHTLKNYVGVSSIADNLGWKRKGGGHCVCIKAADGSKTKIAVLRVVGLVGDSRFEVSGVGSWRANSKFDQNLERAKFTFTLDKPDGTVFADDWDVAKDMMIQLQDAIGDTGDSRHFLTAEKADYFLPIEVYDHQKCRLLGEEMRDALINSLVDVSFTLKHYKMKDTESGKWYDCFTATVLRINILESNLPDDVDTEDLEIPDGPERQSNPINRSSGHAAIEQPKDVMAPGSDHESNSSTPDSDHTLKSNEGFPTSQGSSRLVLPAETPPARTSSKAPPVTVPVSSSGSSGTVIPARRRGVEPLTDDRAEKKMKQSGNES
uniref:Uncharacterized protein n=1 Tax=Mycena chlorophos TaxID=658473 RepID=A0ABQ0L8I3_MYCCL|nr:predicted protein [Mycena chlorophos]